MRDEGYSSEYYEDWYALTFEQRGAQDYGAREESVPDDDMDFYDDEIRTDLGDNDELELRERGFMDGYAQS